MNSEIMSNPNINLSTIIESITCPITQDIMIDPVLGIDGHTYERTAIEKSLQLKQESPLTRIPMTINNLQPNYVIKTLCNQYHTGLLGDKISIKKISTDNINLDHSTHLIKYDTVKA